MGGPASGAAAISRRPAIKPRSRWSSSRKATTARSSLSPRKAGGRPKRALQASYGNCQGWAQMLCAMKAWVEHGINLREGFYK